MANLAHTYAAASQRASFYNSLRFHQSFSPFQHQQIGNVNDFYYIAGNGTICWK